MTTILLSKALCETYPGFTIAFCNVRHIENRSTNATVESLKEQLRVTLSNMVPSPLTKTAAMAEFFRKLKAKRGYFIASLIQATLGGRVPRSINPAVDLVFVVEVMEGILMGLHDLEKLCPQLELDVVQDDDKTLRHISGDSVPLPSGDIFLRNGAFVMASLTEGPDHDTRVTEESRDILLLAFGSPADDPQMVHKAVERASTMVRDSLAGSPGEVLLLRA